MQLWGSTTPGTPNLQVLLNIVESFIGVDYAWGFYQMVVLPPVFAMSGMPNPGLAYENANTMTPTGSQAFVVVNNMAQHWVGALVTQNNWEDLWINVGFATYIQRFVLESVTSYSWGQQEAWVGNNSFYSQVSAIGIQNQTYSSLHPVL
jgi:aminopeptidase N